MGLSTRVFSEIIKSTVREVSAKVECPYTKDNGSMVSSKARAI